VSAATAKIMVLYAVPKTTKFPWHADLLTPNTSAQMLNLLTNV